MVASSPPVSVYQLSGRQNSEIPGAGHEYWIAVSIFSALNTQLYAKTKPFSVYGGEPHNEVGDAVSEPGQRWSFAALAYPITAVTPLLEKLQAQTA